MIIRHGFMRDNEGRWHNMHMMSNLYVREIPRVREIPKKYIVVAEIRMEDGSNWYQSMSIDYPIQIEAEEALDDAFGYIG